MMVLGGGGYATCAFGNEHPRLLLLKAMGLLTAREIVDDHNAWMVRSRL